MWCAWVVVMGFWGGEWVWGVCCAFQPSGEVGTPAQGIGGRHFWHPSRPSARLASPHTCMHAHTTCAFPATNTRPSTHPPTHTYSWPACLPCRAHVLADDERKLSLPRVVPRAKAVGIVLRGRRRRRRWPGVKLVGRCERGGVCVFFCWGWGQDNFFTSRPTNVHRHHQQHRRAAAWHSKCWHAQPPPPRVLGFRVKPPPPPSLPACQAAPPSHPKPKP